MLFQVSQNSNPNSYIFYGFLALSKGVITFHPFIHTFVGSHNQDKFI